MAIGIFTILAGLLAVTAAYFYFFGISPETKRKMEQQALKTMGENKMSYMAKDQINKIPTSDQEDIKNLKQGISNLAGGAMQNPIGEQAVRVATGLRDSAANLGKNVNWDAVQSYPKAALERVSTITSQSKTAVQNTAGKSKAAVQDTAGQSKATVQDIVGQSKATVQNKVPAVQPTSYREFVQ